MSKVIFDEVIRRADTIKGPVAKEDMLDIAEWCGGVVKPRGDRLSLIAPGCPEAHVGCFVLQTVVTTNGRTTETYEVFESMHAVNASGVMNDRELSSFPTSDEVAGDSEPNENAKVLENIEVLETFEKEYEFKEFANVIEGYFVNDGELYAVSKQIDEHNCGQIEVWCSSIFHSDHLVLTNKFGYKYMPDFGSRIRNNCTTGVFSAISNADFEENYYTF